MGENVKVECGDEEDPFVAYGFVAPLNLSINIDAVSFYLLISFIATDEEAEISYLLDSGAIWGNQPSLCDAIWCCWLDKSHKI